jgi:hypothetical protein
MTAQETLQEEVKVSNRLPQVHATVTIDVFDALKSLADKEKRTLSSMASILIEKGLKDKIRRR